MPTDKSWQNEEFPEVARTGKMLCPSCGMLYEVVFTNDGDNPPDIYCPRCGHEYL